MGHSSRFTIFKAIKETLRKLKGFNSYKVCILLMELNLKSIAKRYLENLPIFENKITLFQITHEPKKNSYVN